MDGDRPTDIGVLQAPPETQRVREEARLNYPFDDELTAMVRVNGHVCGTRVRE
jgi:hypothetical protein